MYKLLIGIFIIFNLYSCSSKSEKLNEENHSSQNGISDEEYIDDQNSSSDYTSDEDGENLNGCQFDDGTYSSTVDYYNPETGYSATYTLDVEVVNCQVIRINFPNDGYLDEDHISYTDIDEDGNASVDGEDGKTYKVHIDS